MLRIEAEDEGVSWSLGVPRREDSFGAGVGCVHAVRCQQMY